MSGPFKADAKDITGARDEALYFLDGLSAA
jgi:hypothetical protein